MNRRNFLAQNAMGIGGVALAWLLNEDRLLATPGDAPRGNRSFDLALKQPHFEPRAKSMISLFMHGGPAHMDLLDPKPELTKRSGEEYAGDVQFSFVNRATKSYSGAPGNSRLEESAAPRFRSCSRKLARSSTTSASSARCTPDSMGTRSRSATYTAESGRHGSADVGILVDVWARQRDARLTRLHGPFGSRRSPRRWHAQLV